MKTLLVIPALFAMLVAASQAAEWSNASLPAYVHDSTFVAIGSDSRLYSVKSNQNGYVFTSLQKQYKFQPSEDGFTGQILSRSEIFYFGKSCDAANDKFNGTWTVNSTGLAFAMETTEGEKFTFHLLSTGLKPSHSC